MEGNRRRRITPLMADDAAASCLPQLRTGTLQSASPICAWGLLALLMGAVLAFGAVQQWSQLSFELGVTVLFVIWVMQQARSRQLALTPAGLYAPAAGFFLVVLAQIAFRISAYRYASESSALLYVAYGIVLLIAIECVRDRDKDLRRRMSIALAGF